MNKKNQIKDLKIDQKNYNKGTKKGDELLEHSISEFGLGRSILIDKNNKIIAGNKTFKKCNELGFDKLTIVETEGDELIAVKRNDIDLDTEKGKRFALADNRVSEINLDWDIEEIKKEIEDGFNLSDFFDTTFWEKKDNENITENTKYNIETKFVIEINCIDEFEQEKIYTKLTGEGYKCRILTL